MRGEILRKMEKIKVVIGHDTGGTNTRVAVAGLDGEIIKQINKETEKKYGTDLLDEIGDVCDQALSELGGEYELVGMTGSMAGGVDYDKGILMKSPNVLDVDGLNFRKYFEDRFGVNYHLLNDGNAAALGLLKYDSQFKDTGIENLVYVILGTGIGGGIIIDGKIYRGKGQAGEIGHIGLDPKGPMCGCGHEGCWEAYSSGYSIARTAKSLIYAYNYKGKILELAGCSDIEEHTELEKVKAEHVFAAAREPYKDPLAIQIIDEVQERNKQAIDILIDTLHPEAIVFGEKVATSNPDFIIEYHKKHPNSRMNSTTDFYMPQIENPGLRGAIYEAITNYQSV